MGGLVRAVAVAEEAVLGGPASHGTRAIQVVDAVRRRGTHVILVTGRTLQELDETHVTLLPHFDAVVAESGAVLQVGPGPARTLPGRPSRRRGFLAALSALDVDPHDTLAISADSRDAGVLDASEVAVAAGGAGAMLRRSADITLTEPDGGALEGLLDDLLASGPAGSPQRHEVRLELGPTAGPEAVRVPGARANVVICASRLSEPDVPWRLLRGWVAAGYRCVLIDPLGRHRRGTSAPYLPGAAVARLGGTGEPEALRERITDEVTGLLVADHPLLLLDLSGEPPRRRSLVASAALLAVQEFRARTGRPHWLVIDDAEVVLGDADLPPEALRLSERGHCLILRSQPRPPASLARGVDLVLPG